MDIVSSQILIFLVLLPHAIFSKAYEVSTSKGNIIGSNNIQTRGGRLVYSFTGIPYAKPPVGNLRFQEPQPTEAWNGTFDATKTGPDCAQVNFITQYGNLRDLPPTSGQEDCLTLNIYSPEVNSSAKLPVMFWIPGGGFAQGSNNLYTPEFLLDKDVVLVTVNYRLFVLGFLSTGDDVIPGNLGLKDQSFALRWVYENIENFGGDPSLITLFGESSGGASVHLNLLSPRNTGLIQRAIAMSGTAFNPWTIIKPEAAAARARTLAELAGCPSNPSEELLQCLQTVPVETLLNLGRTKFQDWLVSPAVPFGPTIEPKTAKNPFLPADPSRLQSNVPFITGINSGEGGLVVSILFAAGNQYERDLRQNPNLYLPKLLQLPEMFSPQNIPFFTQKIRAFYFRGKCVGRCTPKQLIDASTDSWFLKGVIQTASTYRGNLHLYYFDYQQSSVSFNSIFGFGEVKSVCHADDMLTIFPLTGFFPNRTYSETDIIVSQNVISILTDFAKYGRPNGYCLSSWTATGNRWSSNTYLHINANQFSVERNLLPKRAAFWRALINTDCHCKWGHF